MPKKSDREKIKCPRCGIEMIEGSLREASESIYVTSHKSMDSSVLRAFICPKCGHVELVAVEPERLEREDVDAMEMDEPCAPDVVL